MRTPVLSRRALLAVGAAVAAAGCTSEPEVPPAPDPDDVLREQAAERERALLRAYDEALLAVPALAPLLVPLRGQHSEHLLALLGPEATPTATATPVAAAQPAPNEKVARAALVEAERAAGAAHGAAALEASRELAGLLAALSASELSHPVVLA